MAFCRQARPRFVVKGHGIINLSLINFVISLSLTEEGRATVSRGRFCQTLGGHGSPCPD